MLLAIDTATQVISLALHDKFTLRAEVTWYTSNNHTAELAPMVNDLLTRCDLTPRDLTALAVSVGPGSFTGVRIGVSLAKGMAEALGLPLVGVSTLDTLAAGQPYYQGSALVVAIEAGRGRLIAATYRWSKGRWVHRGEPQLMDWETLFASIDGLAYLTGDLNAQGEAALASAQAQSIPVRLVPAAYRLRRAGFLAQEALARLEEGEETYTADKLAPLYVKTKDIP